jgi:hypothetical protein
MVIKSFLFFVPHSLSLPLLTISYLSLLLDVLINSIIFSLSLSLSLSPHKFIPIFSLSPIDCSSPHQFNPISRLFPFLLTLSLLTLPLLSHIASFFSHLYSFTINSTLLYTFSPFQCPPCIY